MSIYSIRRPILPVELDASKIKKIPESQNENEIIKIQDLNKKAYEKENNKKRDDRLMRQLEARGKEYKTMVLNCINEPTVVQEVTDAEGNVNYLRYSNGLCQYFKKGKISVEILPDKSSRGYFENGDLKFEVSPDGLLRTYYPTGMRKEIRHADGSAMFYDENGFLIREYDAVTGKEYRY